MNRTLLCLILFLPGLAMADANSDAFNAGAAYGKGNASQGSNTLANPGVVSGSIPGYTSSPPESGYYGGVNGGDGGLADKGTGALGNNAAGQAIIESGTKNPMPAIDPSAPYITIGKNAETNAGSIVDGTNSQCTSTTVSKSTFENFTCSADVAVTRTCVRSTEITGHYETQATTRVVNIAPSQFVYGIGGYGSTPYQMDWSFPLPAGAKVLSGTLTVSAGNATGVNWTTTLIYPGGSTGVEYRSGGGNNKTVNIAAFTVPDSGLVTGAWENTNSANDYYQMKLFSGYARNGTITLRASVTIVTDEEVWVPGTTTPAVCPDGPGGKVVTSVCSIPGGDRETTVNGVTKIVHSDCWQYTDTVLVSETTAGTCATLAADAACTVAAETCTEFIDEDCSHKQYTYQCQKVFSSEGLLCGGQYFCKSGDCSDTDGAGDSGFDTAVAKLAGLAAAGEDMKNGLNGVEVRAFTGEAMSCRKAFAGFSNCCKDSGWGQDTGLAACNSEEMAIGKAKTKKVTVSVGDRCDHKVLGVCVQKSQVYCVFGGKLARIIQEQGRRDQLGVGFGSGDEPDCRGISIPELQGIDFDRVNFSDFYQDLMDNQKIPDTGVMVKQIKDRIANQVQQQSSGATK